MRMYLNIETLLSSGWYLQNGSGGSTWIHSPMGEKFILSPDAGKWFLNTSKEAADLPAPIAFAFSGCSIKKTITDKDHITIIDCGEHVMTSASAEVCKESYTSNDGRTYPIKITVVGKTAEDVMHLYRKILRGRQADEPYYKITSLKRWLLVRIKRFTFSWMKMNTDMRGEA